MNTSRTWLVAAGVALWLPMAFSFLGSLSVGRLAGSALSQLPLVALLTVATLLLGMLIGRTACSEAIDRRG